MSEKTNIVRSKTEYSKTLRCGKRTYFFDVKKEGTSKKYLVITKSRLKDEGRIGNGVIIFEEDIDDFKKIRDDIINHINKKAKIFIDWVLS